MNPFDLLPQRYPFLLLDHIDIVEVGRRAFGRKQVRGFEWHIIGARDGCSSVAMPMRRQSRRSRSCQQRSSLA